MLDFGVARQLVANERSLTLIGTVVGTPAFMAPEQIMGQSADPSIDVYALGASLYCMLTGRLPLEAETPHELFQAHARQTIARPSSHLPAALPDDLDGLVMECLSQDPAHRPRDGAALLARLDALGLAAWSDAEAAAWWEAARVHAAEVLSGRSVSLTRARTAPT